MRFLPALSLLLSLSASAAPPAELRLELVRESLLGTHYRYRQYIDGIPVVNGGSIVTITRDGDRFEEKHLARADETPPASRRGVVALNRNGVAVFARREVRPRRGDEDVRYVDLDTGDVLLEESRALHVRARVFQANPVVLLNDPLLKDDNDSAGAVPEAAYSIVDFPDLTTGGPLAGPNVTIADFDEPAVAPVDAADLMSFDRSQPGFEDVNAYFHIDRSQRYLQSLGYRGALQVAPYSIPVDVHAESGRDNSYYLSRTPDGHGSLYFGEGGTDDAEDSDLLLHEYAHAIQDWIAPSVFAGSFASQSRAMGEAIGDYWAFSAKYSLARASGRDPFCFADWDARCWQDDASQLCGYQPSSDCLRRLDGTKTMADFVAGTAPGTEHRNGEIWSSALRDLFLRIAADRGDAEGKRIADTLVIESLYDAPPDPTFAAMARRLVLTDRMFTGGRYGSAICSVMLARGILGAGECDASPRGEIAVQQSTARGVAIPDNDVNGVASTIDVNDDRTIADLAVAVDIEHPVRGDLRLTLTAPDGTTVQLIDSSPDRGHGLHGTFGVDIVPQQSLVAFAGRSARGTWTLRVSDLRIRDVGTLDSWSLVIRYAGEERATARPSHGGSRQIIPVAGHVAGANATRFETDLRLVNASGADQEVMLVFTPSTHDGRFDFASAKVIVPAGASADFTDVVDRVLHVSGTGQLEIDGNVTAAARINTVGVTTVSGADLDAVAASNAITSGSRGVSATIERSPANRVNVGAAEITGRGGDVRFRFVDVATGASAGETTLYVLPYSHVQVPAAGCAGCIMRVELEPLDDIAVVGYVSVVDNASGGSTIQLLAR